MKQNRHLEEYVNNKYLFVGIYAGYQGRARVIKKVRFEDEKGNVIKVNHFNIYPNQFKNGVQKFKDSEKNKKVIFYGKIGTYPHDKKENGIDYCVEDVIIIR